MLKLSIFYVVFRHTACITTPTSLTLKIVVSKALVAASLKPFVLSILAESESYGYAIIQRVRGITDGNVKWTTSTLYPVLHSLENDGLLRSHWKASPEGPRRKYYRLTAKGRNALLREKRQWLGVHEALMQLWSQSGSGTLKPV